MRLVVFFSTLLPKSVEMQLKSNIYSILHSLGEKKVEDWLCPMFFFLFWNNKSEILPVFFPLDWKVIPLGQSYPRAHESCLGWAMLHEKIMKIEIPK